MTDLSSEDRTLLARLAMGEASSDPDERAGVIATALNRVGKSGYGDSVKDVIFQPKQFAATQNKKGGFYRYSADDYADARNIVDGIASGSIDDPTGGAVNFHAASMNPPPKWARGQTAQQIGQTKFYGGTPPQQASNGPDFLSQFEKDSTPAPNTPNTSGPDFLSQFEPPAASELQETQPTTKVAGPFDERPAPAMEKPLQPAVSLPYEKEVTDYFKKNPEAIGALAGVLAGTVAPEFTFARALPALLKGGWSLAKHGAGKVVDFEILSHLLHP